MARSWADAGAPPRTAPDATRPQAHRREPRRRSGGRRRTAANHTGRDPAEIEWALGVEPDDLGRFLQVDAEAYVEMGFSQFTLGFNGPESCVDAAAVRRWLAW